MNYDYSKHVLEVVTEGGQVEAYYLREPGKGRMGSTLVMFSPEGITIAGDMCPCLNGVTSSYGYGKQWFAGNLGKDYLCGKFLHKEFVPDKAAKWLRETTEFEGLDIHHADIDDLALSLESGEADARDVYEFCYDNGIDGTDLPGTDYNPRDADLLEAIQKRFAELWQERQPTANPARRTPPRT